jgi:hypothetical protein
MSVNDKDGKAFKLHDRFKYGGTLRKVIEVEDSRILASEYPYPKNLTPFTQKMLKDVTILTIADRLLAKGWTRKELVNYDEVVHQLLDEV